MYYKKLFQNLYLKQALSFLIILSFACISSAYAEDLKSSKNSSGDVLPWQEKEKNIWGSLSFSGGEEELSNELHKKVEELVVFLKENKEKRILLKSYATEVDKIPGSDRRISLKRALAVRDIIEDKGIDVSRVSVQSLGKNKEENPKDRIDIKIL